MINIGIVGFDTSHAVEFTKRINHKDISEDHWVYGARVKMGYPASPSSFVDDNVIAKRTQILREYGVEIVNSAEEMIGKVDAVLLEQQEGGLHLEMAKPFIEAGIALFIDKPFACSVSDARKIFHLAQSNNVPVFSSSALRYALEIQDLKQRKDLGDILGAETYSPATFHPKNPGLFNYGIHGVEMLYAIMGTGCESVRCFHKDGWDVVVGIWRDGRIGVFRGMRKGPYAYGFTAFYEKGIFSSSVDTRYVYRELLKRVIEMFETRRMPVNPEETIELISFLEASLKSSNENSREYRITDIMA